MSSQYCKPSGSDPVWRCPVCGQWWQLDLPDGDFWEPISTLKAFLQFHPEMESRTQTPKGPHMSIDITQQALNALADAGLGNDSPAEAYVIGYTQGHDDALALAIQLERSINRRPFMPDEAERLAMRLHEQVGDCPIAHESGNAMDDSEREWWVNLAASAWTLIDGTEETE
ncbi:MAG: hypothetical protein ACLRY0_10755 [Bifidobacterium longum]